MEILEVGLKLEQGVPKENARTRIEGEMDRSKGSQIRHDSFKGFEL